MTIPARKPDGRWAPGTSGNPAGRPASTARQMLEQALAEKDATTGRTALEEIIQAAVGAARQGDVQAAALILDRVIAKLPRPPVDAGEAGTSLMDAFKSWPPWLRSAAIVAMECRRDPLNLLPEPIADAIVTAFETAKSGADLDPAAIRRLFDAELDRHLDEAQKLRLFRAAFDEDDLRELPPEELARRFALLDPADVEVMDRAITQLRVIPIDERIERWMNGEPEPDGGNFE